jgi:PKD repeat protein
MRNFYFFRQLLFGLCCAATLLVTTRSVNAAGPAGKEERASIGRPLPGWFQPGLPLSARLAWLSSFGQLTNDDDPKNGNDPIRFFLTSDKREVTLGEEVEIKVVAELMDIHPSSLFVMEGSNGFTIKVVFPDGFRQTGGTYTDYVGDQLTRDRPIREYTIRGVFERMPPHSNFQLLRGPSGAAAGSVFAYKRTHTVYVYNKELAGGREASPTISTSIAPMPKDSVMELATSATCTAVMKVIKDSIYCDGTTTIPAVFRAENCQPSTIQWRHRIFEYDYYKTYITTGVEVFQMSQPGWLIMSCTPVGCSNTYTTPETWYYSNQPRIGARFYNNPDCNGTVLSTISAEACGTRRARFIEKLGPAQSETRANAGQFVILPDTTHYRVYFSECLDVCDNAVGGAYTWYIPPIPTAKDFLVWVKAGDKTNYNATTLAQVRSRNTTRMNYDGTSTISVWAEGCIKGTIYVDGVATEPKRLKVTGYDNGSYTSIVRDYLGVKEINPQRQYIEIRCKTECQEETVAKVYLGNQTSSGFKLYTDKDEVCAGDSTTLSAFGCSTGTLKWLSNMTLQSDRSIAKPTVSTWYKATCTLSGVTYRDSVFVNVAAVPTVRPGMSAKNLKTNVTVTSSGQTILDLDFDYGSSVQLTASGCPAGNSVTWYNNQKGLLTALTGTTVTVTPGDVTQYWASCKNAAGCEGPVSTKIQTKPRISNIQAFVNNGTSPAVACTGTPASLKATGCGGDVRWFIDDLDGNRLNDVLVDSTKENIVRTVTRMTSASYYAACSFAGKDVSYSNTVEVIVPAATVSVEGGASNIVCRNTPVSLVAKGCHATANVNWFRKDGTNWVAASETPTRNGEASYLSVAPTVVTVYMARCQANACMAESNSQQVNVIAASTAAPDARIGTVTTRKICIGKSFTLFVANQGANDIGYVWQAPNGGKTFGDPKTRAGSEVSLTMESAYSGTWTLLIYDNCSTTPIQKTIDIAASKQIFITAFKYDLDGKKIKIYNNSYLVTNNGPVTTGLKYRWDFGDTKIDSINRDPEHTYAESRAYQVGLTVVNTEDGCDATLSQAVTVGCTRPAAPVISQAGTAASSATVCNGQSLTLQAAGCTQSAVWFVNNRAEKLAETVALNPVSLLTQPGQYQLVAMCQNGTGSNACQSDLSAPFTLTITTPPTPVVRLKDNKTGAFLASGSTYTPGQSLTVSAEGCDAYGTLRWVVLKGTDTLTVPQGSAFTFPLVGLTTVPGQQYKFSAFCRQSSASTTCQGAQSTIVQMTVGNCSPVSLSASAPISAGKVTVCSGKELKLTASGGNGLYEWYRDSLKVGSGTDFYPSTSGKYRATSCQGSTLSAYVTVELLAAEVSLTLTDTTVKVGSSLSIYAKDISPAGTQFYTNVYKWIGPGMTELQQTFLALNAVRPDQAGTYKVTLSKTANGVTCVSSASARVTVQAADCNLKITEPLVTCGTGGATLKVNYTGGNPALNRQFSLDGITYQSDSLFRNLKDSTYTLYLRERSGDQGQVCQAASKEAMVFCDTVGACNLYIVAKDENGKKTDILARNATNELRPLTLSVGVSSGKVLGIAAKYEWTGPVDFHASTPTILAKSIGKYIVKITRGNFVCFDSLKITAEPCGNIVPIGSCGSNGNFTAVPDEPNNRLTSLAAGDVIRAGDFDITITAVISGGPSGWYAKGYTQVPYMNSRIAVELKNAVINTCYQLTLGNASPTIATVQTVYDSNWTGVLDIDAVKSSLTSLIDATDAILGNYKGSQEDKSGLAKLVSNLSEFQNVDGVGPLRTSLQSLIDNCGGTGGRVDVSLVTSAETCTQALTSAKSALEGMKGQVNAFPPDEQESLTGNPQPPQVNKLQLDGCKNLCNTTQIPCSCNETVQKYFGSVFGGSEAEYWKVAQQNQVFWISKEQILSKTIYKYCPDNLRTSGGTCPYREFFPENGESAGVAFANVAEEVVYTISLAIISGGVSFGGQAAVGISEQVLADALEEVLDAVARSGGDPDVFANNLKENVFWSAFGWSDYGIVKLKNLIKWSKVKDPGVISSLRSAKSKIGGWMGSLRQKAADWTNNAARIFRKVDGLSEVGYKEGWNKERVLAGERGLDVTIYLTSRYISRHAQLFREQGASFIFRVGDVVNSDFSEFNPEKFVMLRSDMRKVVDRFKQTKDTDYLEDALGYSRGYFRDTEIFVLDVDNAKVLMPDGKKGGVNSFWLPGGYTSGGLVEGVLDNVHIFHGKDMANLPAAKAILNY